MLPFYHKVGKLRLGVERMCFSARTDLSTQVLTFGSICNIMCDDRVPLTLAGEGQKGRILKRVFRGIVLILLLITVGIWMSWLVQGVGPYQ